MYFIGTLNKDVADMNLKCADEKGALTMGEQGAGEHLADLAKAGRDAAGETAPHGPRKVHEGRVGRTVEAGGSW